MHKVIQVKFTQGAGKSYSYISDIEGLEVGDPVVVWGAGTMSVAYVSKTQGLSQSAIGRASSLIVQKVDLVGWNDRRKKVDLIREIKNELRSAKEQQDEMEIYRTMAKTNPTISGLLEKLAELDAGLVPAIEEK